MSQQIVGAFITKLREELLNQAESCVRFPREEPFHHGCQVGVWQGLEKAHQLLESVLRDDEEQEATR